MKLFITLAIIAVFGAAIYAVSLSVQNRQKRLAPAGKGDSHAPGSPAVVAYGSDGGACGGDGGGGAC